MAGRPKRRGSRAAQGEALMNRALQAFQQEVHAGKPHKQNVWDTRGQRAAVPLQDANTIGDFLGWVPMTSGELGEPGLIIDAAVKRMKRMGLNDEQIAEVIERAT